MPFIADVANGQQILSAWGNNIRNRTVQCFNDMTEANAYVGPVPNGALAHINSTGEVMRMWGGWQHISPLVVNPAPANSSGYYLTTGAYTTIFTATIPAGYRFAHHVVQVTGSCSGTNVDIQCKIWHGGGTFLVGQSNWRNVDINSKANVAFGCWPCSTAGEIALIQCINVAGAGDWSISGNTNLTNYCLTLYP